MNIGITQNLNVTINFGLENIKTWKNTTTILDRK